MDYIGLFRSISNKSKYANWYENMMRAAQSREPVVGGERHHIIPRSFGMGGSASKANIVALTGREHFVAHRLLHKSLSDRALKKKALFAVFQMTTRMTVGSRVAGSARDAMAAAVRELWSDEEYVRKQADAAKTKYASIEYSKRRSELTKRQMSNEDQRSHAAKTLADAHKKIDHSTDEWVGRSFRSEAAIKRQLEATKSDDFRTKCREREMRKSCADRSAFASVGSNALRSKFPDEEAYREYLSNRIKGRVKIVNPYTLETRVVHQNNMPNGWILYKAMSRDQKDALRAVTK